MKKRNLIFISLILCAVIAGSMEARLRHVRGHRGHSSHRGHSRGAGLGAFFGALLYNVTNPDRESRVYYESVNGRCPYCNSRFASPRMLSEHIWRYHTN